MKRVILIIFLILIPLGVFSPGLVSLLWHVRHGNNIEYAGKRIPVPLRWYAHIESHSVQLSKLPITVFFLGEPHPVWSFLEPNPGHMTSSNSQEEIYKSFVNAYWTLRPKNGDVVSGPIRIAATEGEAICMKSFSPLNKAKLSASCLMFGGTWMAEFIGDKKEISDFFQVISGTSSLNANAYVTRPDSSVVSWWAAAVIITTRLPNRVRQQPLRLMLDSRLKPYNAGHGLATIKPFMDLWDKKKQTAVPTSLA